MGDEFGSQMLGAATTVSEARRFGVVWAPKSSVLVFWQIKFVEFNSSILVLQHFMLRNT